MDIEASKTSPLSSLNAAALKTLREVVAASESGAADLGKFNMVHITKLERAGFVSSDRDAWTVSASPEGAFHSDLSKHADSDIRYAKKNGTLLIGAHITLANCSERGCIKINGETVSVNVARTFLASNYVVTVAA